MSEREASEFGVWKQLSPAKLRERERETAAAPTERERQALAFL